MADPVGPDNDAAILTAARGGLFLCCWGSYSKALGMRSRAEAVCSMLSAAGVELHCLRLNADGSPEHTLMLPYGLRPVPFTVSPMPDGPAELERVNAIVERDAIAGDARLHALVQAYTLGAEWAGPRVVELERALLRAHIRHGAPLTMVMLTGPRRGVWAAWNGQGAIGIGMLALKPRARWARLVAIGVALPAIGVECAAVGGAET